MNSFRLLSTTVIKSEMDFSRAKNGSVFDGTVNLTTTTKTPRNPEKNRNIYCSVIFSLGGDNDSIKIRMETRSKFEIAQLDDPAALQEDSKSYCPRRAAEEALRKLEVLTEAHMGQPLRIPLPPDEE